MRAPAIQDNIASAIHCRLRSHPPRVAGPPQPPYTMHQDRSASSFEPWRLADTGQSEYSCHVISSYNMNNLRRKSRLASRACPRVSTDLRAPSSSVNGRVWSTSAPQPRFTGQVSQCRVGEDGAQPLIEQSPPTSQLTRHIVSSPNAPQHRQRLPQAPKRSTPLPHLRLRKRRPSTAS
jgi:hypothetical protein